MKAVVQANRNGFFYALDRTNGKLLVAKPYTKVSWASEIGRDGRPKLIRRPGAERGRHQVVSGPGRRSQLAGHAYSPQTGLYYFGSTDGCHVFYKTRHDAD